MKQVPLNAQTRPGTGRTKARQLRKDGAIPAVIYGESGVRHLTIDGKAFANAWREISGKAALLELAVDGETDTHFAIIREIQRNPRTDAFLHIDLGEIQRGRDMEAEIPVRSRGIAEGVRTFGGVLEINASTLRVRCRPRDLPETIVVDVSAMLIGDSIHRADLVAPEGVVFLDDADLVVVSCVGSSAGAAEAATAAPDQAAAEGVPAEPAKAS
jgi:large subunit ribosomal protein L25